MTGFGLIRIFDQEEDLLDHEEPEPKELINLFLLVNRTLHPDLINPIDDVLALFLDGTEHRLTVWRLLVKLFVSHRCGQIFAEPCEALDLSEA